jgi:3-oxoacyl-(acyl-carrier-protein) synthase
MMAIDASASLVASGTSTGHSVTAVALIEAAIAVTALRF